MKSTNQTHLFFSFQWRLLAIGFCAIQAIASTQAVASTPAVENVSQVGEPERKPPTQAGQSAELIVQISGARSDKGTLVVSLFNKAESFPKTALRTEKIRAHKGRGHLTIRNLKPGTYAIAVAHDANNNGEMDTNQLGLPTEGFGFSNQAPVVFGPPKFEAASFPVRKAVTKTHIKLRYL